MVAKIGKLGIRLYHDAQDLQGADKPVACRVMIQKYHMAALLSSEIGIMLQHILDDITVSHLATGRLRCPNCSMALIKPKLLMTVATTLLLRKSPCFLHISGADSQNRVAIDNLGIFIHHDHAVGIAIQGDAYIGPMVYNSFLNSLRDATTRTYR